MSAPQASCTHHPLREAVGICVRCSTALCSDCITKVDGINHCSRCLSSLPARQAATKPRSLHLPSWLAIGFGMGTLSFLAWLMLEVLMPGEGGR